MEEAIKIIISMLQTGIEATENVTEKEKVQKTIDALTRIKDSDATTQKEQMAELTRIVDELKADLYKGMV